MRHTTGILFGYFMANALFFSSCQEEKNILPVENSTQGRIEFRLSYMDYVNVDTRAEKPLTDLSGYTFTLTGTDDEGNEVNHPITLQREDDTYSSIVPAGTYTLTTDNMSAACAGTGAPYYNGTSEPFSIVAGGKTAVNIVLGTPRNALINFGLDASFTSLYENCNVTFNDDTRSFSLSDNGQAYAMIPADGRLAYTVFASAKAGSHVTDLPQDGLTCHMQVEAGRTYSVVLTAKSVSDPIIGIGDGEYEGEFE